MKKIISVLTFLIVCILIITPRFYHLGSQPPGLHIDEVSFAADAKSLAETGKDTWGVTFPRVFKAFGEWKAPGLTYSMAFWAKVTGTMNNFVARLPSAISGLTIIIMLVMTIRTLYPTTSHLVITSIAVILAFSPWHFDMSRIFYEAFSALAWLSVSLYFATRRLMGIKVKKYEWYLMVATAAIAGYYYASIRYVVIGYVILVSILEANNLKSILRSALAAVALLVLVGIGWVPDLFSDVGLNRLHYYQQKANLGSGLEIDEKRQFCYLSLENNLEATKLCYALWNKPVAKILGAGETVLTYLGTDFLFIHGESEFGFDSEYGAYLPPVITLYLIGLWHLLKNIGLYLNSLVKRKVASSTSRIAMLYVGMVFLSLVPAAAALNLNMRMAMVSLYLVGLISSIGLIEAFNWLSANLKPIIKNVIVLAFIGIMTFYTIQSLVHYFFVFTHSNDMQWTSDAGPIFNYVKSVSKNYDRIIDTDLHGPLAPYFYGDLTSAEVLAGEHSKPDDIGFSYLIKAGKYELVQKDILDLACEKLGNRDTRKTLVITEKSDKDIGASEFTAFSWNKANIMRQVYDLDKVVAHQLDHNSSFKNTCTKK